MVKKLELNHVCARSVRVERIGDKFDYIVARAVECLPNFLKNVRNVCKRTTRIFYIKGGDFEDELRGMEYRLHNIGTLLGDGEFGDKVIIEIFNG
jgi:16S rRNA G527 N7-methylase RsmG